MNPVWALIKVWNKSEDDKNKRTDDFAEEDIGEMGARHITRQLSEGLPRALRL